MTDLRPSFGAFQGAMGLSATVTVPGDSSVSTTAIWLPPQTEEVPVGGDGRRADIRRLLALPRSDVPQVPRGTIVEMAEEEGGEALSWIVDSMDRVDFDHHRVLVLPYEAGS